MPNSFQSIELLENIHSNNFKESYWPNTFKKLVNLRLRLGKKIFNILYREKKKSLLYLSYYYIMNEIIIIYNFSIITNEIKKKKIKLYSNSFPRIVNCFYNKKVPNFPERFFKLNLKKDRLYYLKNILNGSIYGIFQNLLKRKQIYPLRSKIFRRGCLKNLNVTSVKCSEIDNFIKKKNEIVYYYPIDFWFNTQKRKKNYNKVFSLDSHTFSEILNLIRKTFNEDNVPLEENFFKYFKNLLKNLDFFLNENYLNLNRKMLPKTFLRLSGKNLWLAILSKAVRDNNGEVLGFNHSNGIVNGISEPFLVSELQECDKYITNYDISKTIQDMKKNFKNIHIPDILINDE